MGPRTYLTGDSRRSEWQAFPQASRYLSKEQEVRFYTAEITQ
jgi:hypothetical protein